MDSSSGHALPRNSYNTLSSFPDVDDIRRQEDLYLDAGVDDHFWVAEETGAMGLTFAVAAAVPLTSVATVYSPLYKSCCSQLLVLVRE